MRNRRHTSSLLTGAVLVAVLALLIGTANAADPSWWTDRRVVDPARHKADYAPALLGQLKWFATNACDEIEMILPGGAGTSVRNLVAGFNTSSNYCPINLGQLKRVAKVFYDRLLEVSYTNTYPWTINTTADDADYAVVNIGQLKTAFAFDLAGDADVDGLPDYWEMKYFGSVTNQSGSGDYDSDGYANAFEYAHGLNPTNRETDFGDEDGDGYPDIYEIQHGTDCRLGSDYPGPSVIVTNGGSIQAGINAATNNYDIVLVLQGIYAGETNKNLDFNGNGGKKILVVSQNGDESAVIDCGGSGRGFNFHSSESRSHIFSGFTILNGSTNKGAGIYCSGSSPTIYDCTIQSNTTSGDGGGVYFKQSTGLMWSCTIRDCISGDDGGGLRFAEGATASVYSCSISDNRATGNGGGIAYGNGAKGQLNLCMVAGNTASNDGGGIRIEDSSPTITNCIVSWNRAGDDGGGIRCKGQSSAVIIGSVISYNVSTNSGGGVCLSDTNNGLLLSGCDITWNESFSDGGGIASETNAVTITNCMISGNLAHDNGGGVFALGCATVTVCNVANNQSYNHVGGIYVKEALSGLINGCSITNNYGVDGGGVGFNSSSNGVIIRTSYIYGNHAYQDGGGIRCKTASPVIENCIVTLNEAHLDGGGIECCYTSAPIIRSCSVVANDARGYGGGIAVTAKSTVSITNCIVWTNSAGSGDGQWYCEGDGISSFTGTWSVIQGWTTGGSGMSSNDPCLVPVSCRLTTNSIWCIDHGVSNSVLADWEGETMWSCPGVTNVWTNWYGDIGADEYVDSNSNGMADAWETQNFGSTTNELATGDHDADGLSNVREYELGTNPGLADTDGDGLTDSNEVCGVAFNGTNAFTNPLRRDTDGDGMNDLWEIASATNRLDPDPVVADPLGDPDGDGIINAIEGAAGTDACWYDDPGNNVSIALYVGDAGKVQHESYAMQINSSDVLTSPVGGISSQAFAFPKGGEYSVTLSWLTGNGDYDYKMTVGGLGMRPDGVAGDLPGVTNWLWDTNQRYCIYDDYVILGTYHLNSTNAQAQPNPTTLYSDGVPGQHPYEAVLYVPQITVKNTGKNPLPHRC